MKSVAIAVTAFRNHQRLNALLDNMKWAGLPDIPVYVFEDPVPGRERHEVTAEMIRVCVKHEVILRTAPKWGCMQGIIQYALEQTTEDWIIYVPDDVLFTKGGLWNEYAGVLAYGREWVGGIQAPYWNAHELVALGAIPTREVMFRGWIPDHIGQNPHWNGYGLPRKYINLNGAGFSINRKLWEKMGGWPACTWRLDEYAGYMAWKCGMACITLPGPPRIHYFGATTPEQPVHEDFSSVENWKKATGGTPEETGYWTSEIMKNVPETFDEILRFVREGGSW